MTALVAHSISSLWANNMEILPHCLELSKFSPDLSLLWPYKIHAHLHGLCHFPDLYCLWCGNILEPIDHLIPVSSAPRFHTPYAILWSHLHPAHSTTAVWLSTSPDEERTAASYVRVSGAVVRAYGISQYTILAALFNKLQQYHEEHKQSTTKLELIYILLC